MNGACEESLEITERALEALACERSFHVIANPINLAKLVLQRQVEPAAQLGRRFARERHGSHVLDAVDAGGNPGSHALGEHLRLA